MKKILIFVAFLALSFTSCVDKKTEMTNVEAVDTTDVLMVTDTVTVDSTSVIEVK